MLIVKPADIMYTFRFWLVILFAARPVVYVCLPSCRWKRTQFKQYGYQRLWDSCFPFNSCVISYHW